MVGQEKSHVDQKKIGLLKPNNSTLHFSAGNFNNHLLLFHQLVTYNKKVPQNYNSLLEVDRRIVQWCQMEAQQFRWIDYWTGWRISHEWQSKHHTLNFLSIWIALEINFPTWISFNFIKTGQNCLRCEAITLNLLHSDNQFHVKLCNSSVFNDGLLQFIFLDIGSFYKWWNLSKQVLRIFWTYVDHRGRDSIAMQMFSSAKFHFLKRWKMRI